MSKSSIKAVEYGMWGIPSVLPNYVTYTRNFTNEQNCLTYNNSREFEEQLSRLIDDHDLRETMGQNARDYVRDNRLEHLHAEKRFNLYRDLITSTPKPRRFAPSSQVVAGVSV
jgi:glycosyltransferase involved in cell wall biosynthesis